MNDNCHKCVGPLDRSPASTINETTRRRLTGIVIRLFVLSLVWLAWSSGSQAFAASPAISGPSAITLIEDSGSTNFDYTITDADTPIFAVKTWATSSNTNLVSTNNLVVGNSLKILGLSKTRQLSFGPVADANGTAILTLFASDGTSTNSKVVTLTVIPVNDIPSFTLSAVSITVAEDSGTYSNNAFATVSRGPANEIAQTPTFLVTPQTASDTNKFAIQPAITVSGTNTAGTLIFKTALNQNSSGAFTFNVSLQDSGGTTNGGVNIAAVQTFTINITAVNDAPVISGLPSTLTMFEDRPATNSFTVTDVDTLLNLITLTATSSPTGLVSVSLSGAGTTSGTGTNWTMIITPVADANSTSPITVTLTADDGGSANNTTITNIALTLTTVNDKPSFTISANPPTVLEDAGLQSVPNFATSPAAGGGSSETSQSIVNYLLTYAPTNALLSINIQTNTGTLNYQAATNFNGIISVTARAQDSGGTNFGGVNLSDPITFTITVTAVNDAPVISGLPGTLTMFEDKAATNSFTVTDVDTLVSAVTLTATASPTGLVSSVTFSGTGTNRTMIITPVADANSASPITITITADDGNSIAPLNNTNITSILVTLTAVNDKPTFTLGVNQTVAENAGAQTVLTFVTASSVGPADEITAGQTITSYLVTTSSNAFFTTLPAISTGGNLTYTPATNANGTVTVKVQAQDSGGTANGGVNLSITNSFTITVTPVNDPPVITGLQATLAMFEDRATNITFQLTDIDTAITNITLSATISTDPTVIPVSSITFSGSGTNRTMTILPATNANSVAAITITIQADDHGSANNTVTGTIAVTVTPVNDPPSFVLASTSVTVQKFGTVQTVTSFATAISKGAANESSQTVGFTATAATPSLFSRQPTISTNGILTFTVVNGANSSSTVSVYAKDNGGLANGGANQSATQSFTIAVPPNPFQYLSGEFNGLFHVSTGVVFASSGFLKFTVNTSGVITGGNVNLAGKQYNLGVGQFNIDTSAPTAVFTVNRSADLLPNLTITVVLDASDNWTESFSGNVSNGSWTADLVGDHAYKDTFGFVTDLIPSFDAGKYTLFVPGNGAANLPTGAPSGYGWGTVTVDPDGTVHLVGELADGQGIAQTNSVSVNGMWPLFGNLYTGPTQDGGVLLGWVTFDNTDPNNDLSGAVSWIKNPDSSASDYVAGFVNDSTLEGSAYVAPSSLQSAFDPLTSGSVTFDKGGLGTAPNPAYIFYADFGTGSPNWNAVPSGALTPTIDANNTLLVNPTTGAISGTFDTSAFTGLFTPAVLPAVDPPVSFKGVVFQKTSTGRGYFMSPFTQPDSGGSVVVGP